MNNHPYGHPYVPYDVQVQFMDALYETLSTKRVGIFESPTGTGKTLSLLGPAVAWLRNLARQKLQADLDALDASGGPEWSIKRAKEIRVAAFENTKHQELVDAAKKSIYKSQSYQSLPKRQRHVNHAKNKGKQPVDTFVLEEKPKPGVAEALALWTEFNAASASTADDDSLDSLSPLLQATKIFFASRTHSQLAQVADALATLRLADPVRFVTLGSRKQLCIHPDVTRLANVNQMNEKCTDLQKHAQCEFRHNTEPLRNQALGEIMDIEDLASFGKSSGSCPYYAVREVLPYAEVVALPYPLLLVDRNRQALGLDLTESVVIIDEAHNLIDTITSLNSAQIDGVMVQRSLQGLQAYMARVGGRLSANNRRKVAQVIKLIESVATYFANLSKPVKPGTRVESRDLFAKGNADTLNIPELSEFVQSSKLVYKVDSYMQFAAEDANNSELDAAMPGSVLGAAVMSNSLGTLMDFLTLATDPLAEGELFLDIVDGETPSARPALRYLLLDPSPAFKTVMSDAKAVVLAGGTMEPVSDFKSHLLPYIREDDFSVHSFGHIVPRSQLLTMPISSLQFTFANRGSPEVMAQLGKIMLDICANVPHGVVAFFPGYKYLAQVVGTFRKTGLLAQLEKLKRVFWETNDPAKRDPDVFAKYSRAAVASKGNGAVLLAVVGGRLSEGINFSDDLARAVVMVGLPYPNAFSAEMVAKRAYIESTARRAGRSDVEAKSEARQYYENLAMRAVNQSVGRAIRHKKDYAAIYLVDERYKHDSVQQKLSKWVRESIAPEKTPLVSASRDFFDRNVREVRVNDSKPL